MILGRQALTSAGLNRVQPANLGVRFYPNQEGRITLRYLNWEINLELPEETFVFISPEGSEKVERYFEQSAEDFLPKRTEELEERIEEAEKFYDSMSHKEIIKLLEEHDTGFVDIEALKSMNLADTKKILIEAFRKHDSMEMETT